MLKAIRRHTQDSIFQPLRVLVTYRKGQRQLKNDAKHPESTLARPPIYDLMYPERISIAPPGNSVGVIKLTSLLLYNRI